MSFNKKVVIVTGASSGIGAATAIAFAQEGAKVVIVGRSEAKLNNIADVCASVGASPLIIKADVSIERDAERVINTTKEEFGNIDVLVNNAGVFKLGTLTRQRNVMNTYEEVMNTNVRAPLLLTYLAIPYLTETKGNIVNISSVSGKSTPVPPSLVYSMSKAALNHFTKGAAYELASSGIRVNSVSPGPVKTDLLKNAELPSTLWNDFASKTLLKKIIAPEEVANLILYVASDKAKSITGVDFVIDNGMQLNSL